MKLLVFTAEIKHDFARQAGPVFGYDYLINHHYIKIDSLFSTYMYCINDTIRTWEEKYFNGLKNAVTFNFTGETLAIKTNSNIEMIFRAE